MKTKTLKKETEYIRKHATNAQIVYVPNSPYISEITFKYPVLKIEFGKNSKIILIHPNSKVLNEIEKTIPFIPGRDDKKNYPKYKVSINSIKYQNLILENNEFSFINRQRVDCKLLK